jgi:hypothetical protein
MMRLSSRAGNLSPCCRTVFEVFNDEQDAVNSFFPNREIRKFVTLRLLQ